MPRRGRRGTGGEGAGEDRRVRPQNAAPSFPISVLTSAAAVTPRRLDAARRIPLLRSRPRRRGRAEGERQGTGSPLPGGGDGAPRPRLLVARLKAFNTRAAAGLKDGNDHRRRRPRRLPRERSKRGGLAMTVASLAKGHRQEMRQSLDVAAKFRRVRRPHWRRRLSGCLAPQIDCAVCTAGQGRRRARHGHLPSLSPMAWQHGSAAASAAATTQSVARQWNEQLARRRSV